MFLQAFDFVQSLQARRTVSFAKSARKDASMPALIAQLRRRVRRPSVEEYINLLPLRILQDQVLFDEAMLVFVRYFHPVCTGPAIGMSVFPEQDDSSFFIVDIPHALQDFQPFLMLCIAVAREQRWKQISARAVLDFLRQENVLTGNLRTSAERLHQQYLQPFAKLTPDDLFRIVSAEASVQPKPRASRVAKRSTSKSAFIASIQQANIDPKAKAGIIGIAQQLNADSVSDLYSRLAKQYPENQDLLTFLTAKGVISRPYPREWLDLRQKLPVSSA